MQIERAVIGVTSLGPGNRLGIWTNGCHRRCKGCVSERLRKPCPENEVSIEEYFDNFYLEIVDGITVSGGEPFDQLSELSLLVDYFHSKGFEDILIYTGFTLEELLDKKDEKIDSIFKKISVLIDGPYIQELDTGKGNLTGSDNQRIIFLKPEFEQKYKEYYSDTRKMQEHHLGNVLLATGIPNGEYIEKFKKKQ